jgi:hypothetical protein
MIEFSIFAHKSGSLGLFVDQKFVLNEKESFLCLYHTAIETVSKKIADILLSEIYIKNTQQKTIVLMILSHCPMTTLFHTFFLYNTFGMCVSFQGV